MPIKKLLDKNNPENTIVRIVFRAEGGEYECVGVLTKENDEMLRVAFTAKSDVAVDYLDVRRADIVSVEMVDPFMVEKL